MTLPSMLVVLATTIFLVLERVFPGRELPEAKGWYWRALLVNLVQLGITLALARLWIRLFGFSLFRMRAWNMPLAEGVVGWFIGTFFFYWGHVLRHKNRFWLVFHQVHHSPSRIEIATSFYKHPAGGLRPSSWAAGVDGSPLSLMQQATLAHRERARSPRLARPPGE
jgi:sterol desaturase/sphingolipid hydroxylase (fatty acid hydroxylase superfamily)